MSLIFLVFRVEFCVLCPTTTLSLWIVHSWLPFGSL